MIVLDIVTKYLTENGYDGLCQPEIECGCSIEDFPCDTECNIQGCQPAYRRTCATCADSGACELQTGIDCNGCFHTKPPVRLNKL